MYKLSTAFALSLVILGALSCKDTGEGTEITLQPTARLPEEDWLKANADKKFSEMTDAIRLEATEKFIAFYDKFDFFNWAKNIVTLQTITSASMSECREARQQIMGDSPEIKTAKKMLADAQKSTAASMKVDLAARKMKAAISGEPLIYEIDSSNANKNIYNFIFALRALDDLGLEFAKLKCGDTEGAKAIWKNYKQKHPTALGTKEVQEMMVQFGPSKLD